MNSYQINLLTTNGTCEPTVTLEFTAQSAVDIRGAYSIPFTEGSFTLGNDEPHFYYYNFSGTS